MVAPVVPPDTKFSPRTVVIAAAVIGIGLIVLFILTINSVGRPPIDNTGGCTEPAAASGQSGADPASSKVAAKLREGQITQVDFGRAETAKVLYLYLDLSANLNGPARLNTRVDTFRRDDDGRLSDERVKADATIDGRTVQLKVCFGRKDERLGDPGAYNGSITVDDSRLANSVTVPIRVTMQFVHGVVLWWLFGAVIIPGTWALWVLHTQRLPAQSAFALKQLATWIISVGGVASIVSGTVASAAVYIATYVRDPTWGSSALQPVTLFGAMFSAFVTTAGLAQLTRGKSTGG